MQDGVDSDTKRNNIVSKRKNLVGHSPTEGTKESSTGTVNVELKTIGDLFSEFFTQFEEQENGKERNDKAEEDINGDFEDDEKEDKEEYKYYGLDNCAFNCPADNNNIDSESMYLGNSNMQDSTSTY